MKSEYNFHEEIKSEVTETDYSSETENDGQILGKFEMVDIHVKKEITDQLLINEELEENLHSSENEIPNNLEIPKTQIKEESSFDSSTLPGTDLTDEKDSIDTGGKQNKCVVIQKNSTLKDYLTRYQLIHKPFACEICEKSFNSPSNLRKHKLVHTGEKPYCCDICQTTFRHLTSLKSHRLIHTNEKPFACEICHNSFRTSTHLKKHKRTHTLEKTHICEICHKSFSDLSNLKKHNLIHTGEKPYPCEICHKSFRYSSYLNKHKQIHSNPKPHCEICRKSFDNSSDMEKHKLSHIHRCEICQKSFKWSSYLDRHKKTHSVK